ncbi:MAG: hypothetical protein IJ874_02350 [Ruminococcus sp.]|nr:hypothetical protein [Ruminococcus sp.]
MESNEKQKLYALRKAQLKRAMVSKFYFEAVFIEYAMLEDRTESLLRHAGGIKLTDRKGDPLGLHAKINKIKSCAPFAEKKVRKRLPYDLLDEVIEWKDKRNSMVHALMKNRADGNELKAVAEQGRELVRLVENAARTVNRYFDERASQNTAAAE